MRKKKSGSKKALTVLQVLPSLKADGGGVERGSIDVALALKAAGHKPIVASAGGTMVHELERAGVKHIDLPLESKNPLVMVQNKGRIEALIRQEKIDIVHARSRAPAWSAAWAASATGTRFMTTFHGAYSGFNTIIKKRYNRVMVSGTRVIAISRFIADHIARHYRVPENRIALIHRGVDTHVFDPSKVGSHRVIQLANKWRLADRGPVIMLPGRLTSLKGHKVMIRALAHLKRTDINCILVGGDQGRHRYRAELKNMIDQMGLSSIVHFAGPCSDMPAAYMLADVVVSASTKPEGFGRVVAEAQALGKPVIVSDHGGAREPMRRGHTGWTFAPGDAQALAHALERALSMTTEQRIRLAKLSVGYIQRHFTKHRMCRKTLDLYREVAEEKHP